MMNYSIYFNKKQQEQMTALLDVIAEKAKLQNQGTCTIHEDFYNQIHEINQKITVVSCNYYDCDGRIAFAMILTNNYNNTIKFEGNDYKGFVFGAPRGHLNKYYKLRW